MTTSMVAAWSCRAPKVLLCLIFACYVQATATASNFTIVNGQIYTPGLGIIDAPQPFTPEGGDFLHVAIDISGDGRIPQPPYPSDVDTGILNITMFLFSYSTGLNLTISNGTSDGWLNDTSAEAPEFHCNSTTTQGFQNAGCEEVMAQESGSTVKHVNWAWPDCLVGDGDADKDTENGTNSTARGSYNVSIHQSFRINGTGYYTIFNLPIEVTNSIPNDTQLSASKTRPLCALRNNPLQNQTSQDASASTPSSQPYLGGNVSIGGENQNESGAGSRSVDCAMTTAAPMLLMVALVSMVLM
ncbi:uncharacterized protein Z518_08083 [Rhinocladiella mackenziei CBS 650.93]|uniref:Uncharacterized protein n=1 Tax=Rhinocladiella mackenziei CBS 650.93 TaxID=1442369 RepID=A0A0D2I8F1_9EURO|nr:uncharacterized protein Z518_08083 [Rhinocladiella mackenziei CBS 650.93]KIX02144.1 hypothetical protein Z518_08083 [Rhinocladiella mackenziei CBS 650.93]